MKVLLIGDGTNRINMWQEEIKTEYLLGAPVLHDRGTYPYQPLNSKLHELIEQEGFEFTIIDGFKNGQPLLSQLCETLDQGKFDSTVFTEFRFYGALPGFGDDTDSKSGLEIWQNLTDEQRANAGPAFAFTLHGSWVTDHLVEFTRTNNGAAVTNSSHWSAVRQSFNHFLNSNEARISDSRSGAAPTPPAAPAVA